MYILIDGMRGEKIYSSCHQHLSIMKNVWVLHIYNQDVTQHIYNYMPLYQAIPPLTL